MTYQKKSRPFRRPRPASTGKIQADMGLHLFCDGAAEPSNPGPLGYGFAVYRDGSEIASGAGGEPWGTNNGGEMLGLIGALEWVAANAPGEQAVVWTDSTYVRDGAMCWRYQWRGRGWKKKGGDDLANVELWQKIDQLLTESPLTKVEWCKGHSGIPGNERADELASIGRASITPDDHFLMADNGSLDEQYRRAMENSP